MTDHLVTRGSMHPRVMRRSVEVVALIRDDQWSLPTPCGDWDLRGLVEHMILENRGFALAAAGETKARRVWTDRRFDSDLRADYTRSASLVGHAFQAAAEEFWLPRINDAIMFPAAQAMSYHLLDYLIHTWDVAASIGAPVSFDPDEIEAVQEIGDRWVPDGERRLRPNAGFRPALRPEPGESPFDRLLRTLGRSPNWPN